MELAAVEDDGSSDMAPSLSLLCFLILVLSFNLDSASVYVILWVLND